MINIYIGILVTASIVIVGLAIYFFINLKGNHGKAKNMKPWERVISALLDFTKQLLIFLFVLIKYIFFIIFRLAEALIKISIYLILILLVVRVGYSFLLNIIGEEPVIDLSKYYIIILISATLCLLVIEFFRLVKDDEKMTDKKRDYLRQSAELLFSSTIYFSVIYIFSLAYTITQDFNQKILYWTIILSKIDQNRLVSFGIIILGLLAVFYFFQALYYLMTKVGTIYEFPEEKDGLTFWERVKRDVNKPVLSRNYFPTVSFFQI